MGDQSPSAAQRSRTPLCTLSAFRWTKRSPSARGSPIHVQVITKEGRLVTALGDRYAIERDLGAGGMATVYLARDLKHDRLVALKVTRATCGSRAWATHARRCLRPPSGPIPAGVSSDRRRPSVERAGRR